MPPSAPGQSVTDATADDKNRAAAVAMGTKIRKLLPQVIHLTHADFTLLNATDQTPLLLDVRTSDEVAQGTLPGAVQVNPSDIVKKARLAATAGRHIVVFCTVGMRSGAATYHLTQHGFSASNYSILTHLWAGGRLVSRDGDWDGSVHAFSAHYASMWPPGLHISTFGSLRAAREAVSVAPMTIRALVAARRISS